MDAAVAFEITEWNHMLILTRRVGQATDIGPDITVTVLGIRGSEVTLGFDAPKSVAIHRDNIKNPNPKTNPIATKE